MPRVPGRSRIAISWAIPGPCGSRRGGRARSSPGPGSRGASRWLVCAAVCVSGGSCAGGAASVAVRIGMGRWSTGAGHSWEGRRAVALCRACGTKTYGTRSAGGGMKARGAKPEGVGVQSNGDEQGGGGWEGVCRSGSRSPSGAEAHAGKAGEDGEGREARDDGRDRGGDRQQGGAWSSSAPWTLSSSL